MELKFLLINDDEKLVFDNDFLFLAGKKKENLAGLFGAEKGLFAFDRKYVFLWWLDLKIDFLAVIVQKD